MDVVEFELEVKSVYSPYLVLIGVLGRQKSHDAVLLRKMHQNFSSNPTDRCIIMLHHWFISAYSKVCFIKKKLVPGILIII